MLAGSKFKLDRDAPREGETLCAAPAKLNIVIFSLGDPPGAIQRRKLCCFQTAAFLLEKPGQFTTGSLLSPASVALRLNRAGDLATGWTPETPAASPRADPTFFPADMVPGLPAGRGGRPWPDSGLRSTAPASPDRTRAVLTRNVPLGSPESTRRRVHHDTDWRWTPILRDEVTRIPKTCNSFAFIPPRATQASKRSEGYQDEF